MSKRNGFVLYQESRPLIAKLTQEQKGDLLDAVFAYDAGEEVPQMDSITEIVFLEVKGKMDRTAQNYEAICERRRDAANKRWADAKASTRMQMDANDANAQDAMQKCNTKTETKTNIKENSPSESKRKAFAPPTVEEVRAYVRDNGYGVNPETFVDFYTSKGWKVGNSPMKDWKACVRTWSRNDNGRGRSEQPDKSGGKYGNIDYTRLLNRTRS